MKLNKIYRRPYVDYKNSVLWTRIDVDWYPRWGKYQCVDLFKHYINKMFWMPIWTVGNANQIRANTFKVFNNTRTRIKWTNNLMQWDVIVRWTRTWYHIAIFDRRVGDKIYVLEQNGVGWGNGRWGNAVRLQAYNPSFRTGVWRCPAIEKNYKKEVEFINNKLLTKWEDKDTLEYLQSIRYVW